VEHRGVPHYDGLYDQSLFFDRRLTEYYRGKGWAMEQMSLLRPMTEILIEKILVERYPDLQRDQVSCHATHIEGGRVRPCGRCEKCRRIVGLLTAIGADPRRCGYTGAQIAACLKALPRAHLTQEAGDVRLLLRLAADPGDARARRGLFSLRWDPVRSPRGELPRDLRVSLLRLVAQHAWPGRERSGATSRPRHRRRTPVAP
jgi:hypothetical protein